MAAADEKDVVEFVGSGEGGDLQDEYTTPAGPLDPNTGDAVGPNGQINWDCPCLQGMADGPCGEQFKAAFSCFVFSQSEEKGSECLEQFKTMHECIQENREYYYKDEDKPGDEAAASSEDGTTPAESSSDSAVDPGAGTATSGSEASSADTTAAAAEPAAVETGNRGA